MRGRSWRGALLALLLSGAALVIQYRRFQDPHVVYDRWELPAFDAYAYVAMAEQPRVFTVAPWGYRVLTPAIVRALPGNVVRGFRDHMFLGLGLASVLLFLFLRRVGHGEAASLVAVLAFAFSPAVAEVVRYPFLVEPVTVALEVAFLLAIERRAGVATLALLATLGALSKELSLMLVPLVLFARWGERGLKRAMLDVVVVATPAVLVTLILRSYWAPQIAGPTLNLGPSTLAVVAARLAESWRETLIGTLLGGLTPIALIGALTPSARPFLRRYAYFLAVTLALPLVAWINIGGPRPMAFFGPNTLRLLLFALPGLLSLALFAAHAVVRHYEARPSSDSLPRWRATLVEGTAATLVCLCVIGLLLGLDRYRRVDLRGFRDGPLVLTLCRESLRVARRLDAGRPVTWTGETSAFEWGRSNLREMDRMRWFLRDGWGDQPHYGAGAFTMQDRRASFLIPRLEPKPLTLRLVVESPQPSALALTVNGQSAAANVSVGAAPQPVIVPLAASLFFRGDNVVTLEAAPGLVVREITLLP
jgi:hypothetical protein